MSTVGAAAKALVGLKVLAVSSDPTTGSLIQLGTWRPRSRPVDNPNLTEAERVSRGSHDILVQCAWELDSPTELRDNPTRPFEPGERQALLQAFVDSTISSAQFGPADASLAITSDTGMALTLHPTRTPPSEGKYSIRVGYEYLTVHADGHTRHWTAPIADKLSTLTRTWHQRWPHARPIGHELRHSCRDQWVRFHSLPGSKRYAETDSEYVELLHRHHVVIDELRHEATGDAARLVVITASWSDSEQPVPRTNEVATVMPGEPWIDLRREIDDDGYENWTHLFVSRIRPDDPALDQLLRLVADYQTGDVIVTDESLQWLYHPYDGGGDVFTVEPSQLRTLRDAHPDWLSTHPEGL